SEILENHWAEVALEKNVMLSVEFGTALPPSVRVGALKVTLDCMIREASVVSVASAALVFQAIGSRLARRKIPLVAGLAELEAKIGEESEVVATGAPERTGLTRVGPLLKTSRLVPVSSVIRELTPAEVLTIEGTPEVDWRRPPVRVERLICLPVVPLKSGISPSTETLALETTSPPPPAPARLRLTLPAPLSVSPPLVTRIWLTLLTVGDPSSSRTCKAAPGTAASVPSSRRNFVPSGVPVIPV